MYWTWWVSPAPASALVKTISKCQPLSATDLHVNESLPTFTAQSSFYYWDLLCFSASLSLQTLVRCTPGRNCQESGTGGKIHKCQSEKQTEQGSWHLPAPSRSPSTSETHLTHQHLAEKVNLKHEVMLRGQNRVLPFIRITFCSVAFL